MSGRRLASVLGGTMAVVGVVGVSLLAGEQCDTEAETDAEMFLPSRDWWITTTVPTLAADVDGVKRAIAAGPDDIVLACQRLLDDADKEMAQERAPAPAALQIDYEGVLSSLRANAERCARGDLYAVRPIVDEALSALTGLSVRYEELEREYEYESPHCW